MLFISSPDLADNSFAFFKYLVESRKKYKFVWIVDRPEKIESYRKIFFSHIPLSQHMNILIYHKKSLSGMLAYIQSKYIFFTHGFYTGMSLPKHQIRINLWHGMPLKAIGYLNKYGEHNTVPKSTYAIATSKIFQNIIAKAFNLEKEKVIITGQPRCDFIFTNTNTLKRLNIHKNNYKKIILWAPTFRKDKDHKINDGKFANGLPLLHGNNDLAKLNKYLSENGVLLIFKLHPMDILNGYDFENFSHITIVKNEQLLRERIQFYSILNEIDILITDYSSIYVDFLLLDRPIVFAVDDFETYRKTRDFVFDAPLEYMPGPIVDNLDSLIKELTLLVGGSEDFYKKKRAKIKQLFHKYDNDFSKRLTEYLKL